MEEFKFGTLPKKNIEVTDDGKIVITSKLYGNSEFKANRIDTIYYKKPSLTSGTGYVYASLDGEQSDNPLVEQKGFIYTKKQQEEVDRFVELVEVLNPDIAIVEGSAGQTVQKKEKKEKVNRHAIKCPKCKSTNVQFMDNKRKGFSVGKAVAGGIMTAGVGTLAGFAGKKGKDRWHCGDCGNVFQKK